MPLSALENSLRIVSAVPDINEAEANIVLGSHFRSCDRSENIDKRLNLFGKEEKKGGKESSKRVRHAI